MTSSQKHNLVLNDSSLVRSFTSLRFEADFSAEIPYSNHKRCENDHSWGHHKGCDEKTSETTTKTATTRHARNARGAHAGTRPPNGLPAIGATLRKINIETRSASRSYPDLD
jgi:hypothetical protein